MHPTENVQYKMDWIRTKRLHQDTSFPKKKAASGDTGRHYFLVINGENFLNI